MKTLLILSLLLTSLPAQSQVMNSTKKPVTEVNLGELIQAQKPTLEEERIARKIIENSKEGAAFGVQGRWKYIGKSNSSCSNYQDKSFLKEIKLKESKSKDKDIVIFVSSSIPQESLKALFTQAQSRGAKLVFRGLIGNSFQKTKAFFETTGINAEIDPTLFEQYQISHVPAFVLKEGKKHDILQGNISLEEALNLIRQKGELKGKAANLLKKNQGNLL